MADPGTILSILGACVTAGKLIYQVQDYYSTANDTLTAMARECSSLRDVLIQVQDMADSEQIERLRNHGDFRQSLERALITCNSSLTLITRQLKRLSAPDQDISTTWILKWSRMAKFKFLWRGSTMKEYLWHLRAHVQALSSLMIAYNTRALMEFNENFGRLRPQVEQISEGVQELLRRNHEPITRSSGYVESILHGPRSSVSSPSSPIPARNPIEPPLASRDFLHSIKGATRWSENQIMQALREIRGFGDADDYVLACEVIAVNAHNLPKCLPLLRQIRNYGSVEDYSEALLIVVSYEEDLQGTRNWLSRVRNLGTQEDYSIALVTTRTHCFAFREVEETLKWFWTMGETQGDYSRTLKFLRSRSYVFSSTKEDLAKLKERSGTQDYSRALRVLEENNFSVEMAHNQLGNPLPSPHPGLIPFSQPPPRSRSPFVGGFHPTFSVPGGRSSDPSSSRQTPRFPMPFSVGGILGHERSRWLRRLFPVDREREDMKKSHRNIESDVHDMCEALRLQNLDLHESDLAHLGQILKYTGFDYDRTKREMTNLASIFPDKRDYLWALKYLSYLSGDWTAMQSIFGPESARVQSTVSFFRTEGISVNDVIHCLTNNVPNGHDAHRCVLKLWQRHRFNKQGIVDTVNQLRRIVNFNSNIFKIFLYLLEQNDLDRHKTLNQWGLLVNAMGGERHFKCGERLEAYTLQALKAYGDADDVVNAFCQLEEFSRSSHYSSASETDSYDAALELLRLVEFNFQDVFAVLYDYQELAQREIRMVGGLPVLLRLVRDGNYNLARAHKTIAFFVGPEIGVTDEQALRLLERHNWSKEAAVVYHHRFGTVH
ncbi:hypothetical protein FRC14_004830 [Serendipita sp. 396]|nr:hypothetical protein FRC14_004830 [Serendipita sp. 396]KAG8781522.1 hypothetical protein FRC15_008595 [Serendipita sp. 397]KAG8797944.1 hypothetical protein FRC16_008324 [Serendipita sp. 398]KAG8866421.1 hypothetical protein FRC20_008587 [Serendipita sp. 405]